MTAEKELFPNVAQPKISTLHSGSSVYAMVVILETIHNLIVVSNYL